MKKIFKYVLTPIILLLLSIVLYFLIAYLFTLFPQKSSSTLEKNEKVHLLYSQMHSDIVLNIKDINLSLFPKFKHKKHGYLAFGWGDKETYLNTPTWNDMSIKTSLKALFINTPSLMHLSYLPRLSPYRQVKPIKVSATQKKAIIKSIMQSFNFEKKRYKGYGQEDFFYTAHQNYNLINTCNTWTGDKLRENNVRMSYWTPFTWSVLKALP